MRKDETVNRRHIIEEGGVVGHLSHLFDNPDLTFAEIKDILTQAADGRLENVSEKLDGMNLVFSWDITADDLRTARNSGDIKGGGMDAAAIAAKFYDRGNVGDAFNTAFKVLRDAIGSLPDNVKRKVFGPKANVWYSMEVIYTENPNVINYDENSIVFHGWPVFEVNNAVVTRKKDSVGVDLLKTYIERMQKAVTVKNWRVRGPAMLQLKALSDGTVLQNVMGKISSAQRTASVDDSDTMGTYLRSLMQMKVDDLSIDPDVALMVLDRCLNVDGAPSLVQIKKLLPKEDQTIVSAFVKSSPALLKEFIQPIEDAISDFAIELLKGLHSTLISDSDAEVMRLRTEVAKAIRAIEASGQDIAMDVLHRQMQKLKSLENITAAMEGVVFIYKGDAYKFTGSFSCVNQILGLFKYGRGGVKIQAVEGKLREYVKLLIIGV
jgi:hypothetical protein